METKTKSELSTFFKRGERPYYIFGPCSAESEEQVMQTAQQISESFSDIVYRAGIWKPRTRPGNFEGVGEKGLKWLEQVRDTFGFQVCTEVANANHVEQCLKHKIDMLWIGARTTANPFSVQEIADALKGSDVPILIKNPIHPDLSLWQGAIERIQSAGIKQIGLLHRGFHYSENVPFRNLPKWDFAIEMKRLLPDFPIICDASHISGSPDLIPKVAQKAFDLAMDGLMIETHISPKDALSDVKQQITPKHLDDVIKNLQFKRRNFVNEKVIGELDALRNKIDHIDEEIIEKLSQRMHYAKKIGAYKKEKNVTILQVNRWNEILEKGLKAAKAMGLSEKFMKRFFSAVHDESISQQQKIDEN